MISPSLVRGAGPWSRVPTSVWLVGVVLLGLALRLMFWTGMALGDDALYAAQAISHAVGGNWRPEPYHWHTRLGVTLPATLSILAFGLKPAVFVLWPLFAGTAAIACCYVMARDFVSLRVALLAAVFLAVFPLDILYATALFPDVMMGLLLSLSLWLWIRALANDSSRSYVLSGLCFGLGYMCRETVFMAGPTYLLLWLLAGRIRRPQMLWVAVAPLLLLGVESAAFAAMTGSPMYRFAALVSGSEQQVNYNINDGPVGRAGGPFWVDPFLMLVTSHEFAFFHVATLVTLPFVWRRWPSLRPVAVWWLTAFLWHNYGTAVPTGYVPLVREPRYLDMLSIPAVILLAQVTASLSRIRAFAFATFLVVTGVAGASMDQGSSVLEPHRAFLRSRYVSDAVLEPYTCFGARWALGLSETPSFSCGDDVGRGSVVRTMAGWPGTRYRSAASAKYLVLSPQNRPELLAQFQTLGWTQVDEFRGRVLLPRRLVGNILRTIPSQRGRAEMVLNPPGLVVLAKP